MQDLPIRNIFLPATLVGASVFSILTFSLPTVLSQRSQAQEIPALNPIAQPNFDSVHKDLAIAYIGTTLVLSTATGIGVAEVLRKRQEGQKSDTSLKSTLAKLIDSHAQQASPEIEAELAALAAKLPAGEADAQAAADPSLGFADTDAALGQSQLWKTDATETTWPDAASWSRLDSTEAFQPEPAETDSTVTIFPGQYQRCRVQVPGLSAQQYAIRFNEQFYSLLNSGVSKEQAIAAIKQLEHQEQRAAILTRMNQGYAVWVLEPDADLVEIA